MSDPVLKLQLLARAELKLAQIRGRRAASRAVFLAVALVFVLLGLGMLTLGCYLALAPRIGAPWAAIVVASADLLIGGVILLIGRKAGLSEGEEELAREIRDMAFGELGHDIEHAKEKLEQITDDVDRIRSVISALTHRAAGTLKPLLSLVTRFLK